MTSKQEKLIENYIRLKVKKLMKEELGPDETESFTTWFTKIAELSSRNLKHIESGSRKLTKQDMIMIAQNIKINCDHIIQLAKTL